MPLRGVFHPGRTAALAVALVLSAFPAAAEPWTVVIGQVTVSPTKVTEQPWDDDGSGPDVAGVLTLGFIQAGTCQPLKKEPIARRQDAFAFDAQVALVVERVRGVELCAQVELWERDVMDDDFIGSAAVRLREAGEQVLHVGQATVVLSFAPSGATALLTPPRTR
jgi:hypothetical protein